MSQCHDLVRFADGELEPARADAFRAHLTTCEGCQDGLVVAMQLGAQLSTLLPSRARAASAPRRWIRMAFAAGVAAVPITAALAFLWLQKRPPPSAPPAPPTFADVEQRPLEIMLAYPGAASYRPMTEARLGGAAATSDAARISSAALAALEARGDRYGLAVARAWNREPAGESVAALRALPQTPSIRADRAALELLTTSNDNVEAVLAELETLRSSPDLAAARAARWNHALLLARLDLPLSAAEAFRAIAQDGEPGWSEEAARRASDLAKRGAGFRDRWRRADAAGQQLVDGGPPLDRDAIRDAPGVVRAYFYQAVGAATSRDRVQALAAMADDLDRLGDPGQHTLAGYVKRVAKLDFRRRAPLAAAYRDLLHGRPVGPSLLAALSRETSSDDIADIVMSAMVERDLVAAHGAWFDAMAARSGDRWFMVVSAREQATSEREAGRWAAAEKRLRGAESLCSPALAYQCVTVERILGELYAHQHRVRDALAVLRKALGEARAAGEWQRYRALLWQVADTERLHSATATVRAYAGEHLLTEPGCRAQWRTQITLAGAALLDVDGRAARSHLERALECTAPDLLTANDFADIARLDPRPGDLAALQAVLAKIRADGALTAAERVFADEIEGRLVIERDHPAGGALLRNAIAAADRMPGEVLADKARAGAYTVLAFDAARATAYPRVLQLIAEDLALPAPPTCAVGMAAEDERAVVVVRGSDGADRGVYAADRGRSAGPVGVPDQLARSLAQCPRIRVMATAALQGEPRVLPRNLAWSYAAGRRRGAAAAAAAPRPGRALIVTGVSPPAYLGLAPLAGAPAGRDDATTLSGAEATPSRVLAALGDAGEVVFHTHALMDARVSDASHLVLSPDGDGQYALTTEAIRGIALRGHPVVALTACQSALGARYQHAPWSLPDAFLAAGARAVFATATDIPDVASAKLFDNVLARVRAGAEPAEALRDERVAAAPTAAWVDDVVLFE